MNSDERILEFYEYVRQQGFSKELLFTAENQNRFIETSVDGYREYPLFLHIFGGKYDETVFRRMMSVDFLSRLAGNTMAGIASSGYESVLLLEPPASNRVGMKEYVKVAKPADFLLLFKKPMYRLEDFEKYALRKREAYLDENTWYVYIFATKMACQHQGYGKKLLNLMLSYADDKKCRICLETNSAANVQMYEHFSFRVMEDDVYQGTLEHHVMLYPGQDIF